jgi:hypothetical protein
MAGITVIGVPKVSFGPESYISGQVTRLQPGAWVLSADDDPERLNVSTLDPRSKFRVPIDAQRRLTDDDIEAAALKLGTEAKLIKAFGCAESGCNGFFASGKVSILFQENHWSEETSGATNNPGGPDDPYAILHEGKYGTEEHQWDKFRLAWHLNPEAAIRSTSYGFFHVGGWNLSAKSGLEVHEFYLDMMESERRHLDAFVWLVQTRAKRDLLAAMRTHPYVWQDLARGYNGKKWMKYNPHYDAQLQAAYEGGCAGLRSYNMAQEAAKK